MSLTLTLKDNGGNPVSGEGTSITLNNTITANFTKFDLYGDTEQQTYTGKNLLNIPDGTYTRNGVTIVILNGVMTFSGVCNGNSDWYITLSSDVTVPANTAYTRSESREGGIRINTNLATGGAAWRYNIGYNGAPTTASMTESTTFHYIVVGIVNGTDYSGGVLKPMLESGSTATSFEPYVGGMSSPNPDYPQEVKTVTGEQTITVSNGQGESQSYPINLGKNLFDLGSNLENYFVTISTGTKVYTDNDKSFVTATFSDNKVTFTDYVTTNWRWLSKVVPLEKNTTYTISGDWTSSLRIVGFNSLTANTTGTLIRQVNPDAGQYPPATFDSGSYNYVVISLFPGEGSKYFDSIQIEKGSSDTTYSPYISSFGKNLCNGVNQEYWVGATTNMTYGRSSGNTGLIVPVESNTNYTISTTETQARYRLGLGDEALELSGSSTIYDKVLKDGTSDSVTLSSGSHKYIVINATDLTKIQVEKGSSASTYEPNFSGQLELCEIGNYQDYLYKSEGNWYIHKETQKNVFNGSENWADASATTGYTRCYVSAGGTVTVPDGYCDEFISRGSGSHGAYEYMWAQQTTNTVYIQVDSNRLGTSSLANFKTWLGSHPASVYRTLATSADYQIKYEPLVAQLDALYNTAHSYNGATIVTSSSQYLPAIMDVTVGGSTNEVTYTETELSNPLTITDIEGKSQNTTLNGNIYVDYAYNKKSFSVSIFNLKSADYATIRGFYDRQFTLNEFPLLSIPELNISEMPVFFEIGSREINSQCIVTDKLTLKFRETAQQ